ncbi:MAG: hypothetical protein IPI57_12160 [Candidatus Competibacteraceae bacterium]|nr:hypothetical protein [Candidatus Competibacteraceae bacterium]
MAAMPLRDFSISSPEAVIPARHDARLDPHLVESLREFQVGPFLGGAQFVLMGDFAGQLVPDQPHFGILCLEPFGGFSLLRVAGNFVFLDFRAEGGGGRRLLLGFLLGL